MINSLGDEDVALILGLQQLSYSLLPREAPGVAVEDELAAQERLLDTANQGATLVWRELVLEVELLLRHLHSPSAPANCYKNWILP